MSNIVFAKCPWVCDPALDISTSRTSSGDGPGTPSPPISRQTGGKEGKREEKKKKEKADEPDRDVYLSIDPSMYLNTSPNPPYMVHSHVDVETDIIAFPR